MNQAIVNSNFTGCTGINLVIFKTSFGDFNLYQSNTGLNLVLYFVPLLCTYSRYYNLITEKLRRHMNPHASSYNWPMQPVQK